MAQMNKSVVDYQVAIKKIVDYLDNHNFEQQDQSTILCKCLAEVVNRARRKKMPTTKEKVANEV